MKKFIAVLLSLLMVFSFTACTNNGGGKEEPTEKPGLAYFCMQLGDLSYNDNGWKACQEVSEKYGFEPTAIELGNNNGAIYESSFLDVCDSGKYSYIVTQAGNTLGDIVMNHAQEYPDIKFVVFDMAVTAEVTHDNVTGIAYAANDACFLGGYVAAALSKTKKVAVITDNDNPLINDFVTGFFDGAKYYDSTISCYNAHSGKWDAALFADITEEVMRNGYDVVFALGYQGCWEGCAKVGGRENGYYLIGVDDDQWARYQGTDDADLVDPIVTSVTKKIDVSIISVFDKFMNGDDSVWGSLDLQGVDTGAMDLAYNEHYQEIVPQDVQDAVQTVKEDIVSGKINPKSYYLDFENFEAFDAWRSAQQ